MDTDGSSRAAYLTRDPQECRELAMQVSGSSTGQAARGAVDGSLLGAAVTRASVDAFEEGDAMNKIDRILLLAAPLLVLAIEGRAAELASDLRAVVEGNVRAYDAKDVDGAMRWVHTRSPEYEPTRAAMAEQFATTTSRRRSSASSTWGTTTSSPSHG